MGCGFFNFPKASQAMIATAPKSNRAFRIETRMVVLRRPYVYLPFGLIVAIQVAAQAKARPMISLILCPASANRAEELAIRPNATSAMTNTTFRPMPMAKRPA